MGPSAPPAEGPSSDPAHAPPAGYVPRLIHVLEDGFTAFAQVWYRGQEITVDEAHYPETCDKSGASWLDLDAKAQMSRFKKVYFAQGAWPFDEYEDDTAKEAEAARARRPRL